MNNARVSLRLGDKVSGLYFETPFVGIVCGFDGSGLQIDIPEGFTYLGVERTGIWISHSQRAEANLQIVTKGPELTDADVGEVCGLTFLRSKKSARPSKLTAGRGITMSTGNSVGSVGTVEKVHDGGATIVWHDGEREFIHDHDGALFTEI